MESWSGEGLALWRARHARLRASNNPTFRPSSTLRRMSEPTESHGPRVEVGRYARLAAARQRGLVVSAKELPHWIEREDGEWVLFVEEDARDTVLLELAAFETEEQERPSARGVLFAEKIPTLSLYVVAWVLSTCFFIPQVGSERWEERDAVLA